MVQVCGSRGLGGGDKPGGRGSVLMGVGLSP